MKNRRVCANKPWNSSLVGGLLPAFLFLGILVAHGGDGFLEFDGTGARVEIPHRPELNPGNETWTCEFWVRLLADFTIGHSKFIAKRDGGGTTGGFYIGSQLAPACSDGVRQNLNFRDRIPVGEWTHVAVQIDREDNKLRAFINGAQVAEADSRLTGAVDAAANLIIGGDSGRGANGNHCHIRDVRIWKGVHRSGAQIRAAMHGPVAPDEPGLVGHWPLNEGEGDTVRDRVADNHGRLRDGFRWEADIFAVDLDPEEYREIGSAESFTFGPVALRDPVGEVTYQWYFKGNPIPGATQPTLTLVNPGIEQAGAYHVAVNDGRDHTPVDSNRVLLSHTDWPMWGYDAARSGGPAVQFPEELHLQWVRHLPPPNRAWPPQLDDRDKLEFDLSYSPVVAEGIVYVASMATDSVTAYRLEDGGEIWRHYMDGPVRLAPTVWNRKVYAVSDDGHLYCLDARTGERLWRFQSAPFPRLVLGNRRLVSMWAARGAPVVKDGVVYFAAGVWPFMGTFMYALDAESGDIVWENTGDSTDWQRQPHGGAYSFAGISPQGYIAATQDRLVVAGGRSTPALLDRQTGELLFLDVFGKGPGGYRVAADEEFFYNHGQRYSLADGRSAGSAELVNESLASRAEALADQLDGPVFEVIASRRRLLVTTVNGTIYCFGAEQQAQPIVHSSPVVQPIPNPESRIAEMLRDLPDPGGFALFVGAGDGQLLEQVAWASNLHIVAIEPDETRVGALRQRLAEAGLYGKRVALIPGRAGDLAYPPYISSLIVAESLAGSGLDREGVRNLLRPYGGKAYVGSEVIVRDGPLPGAGQWTHQYADAARTTLSHDERVRLPLGVLWYGTESHDNILPRHAAGPRPQVAGGRLAILGVETIGVRDVYTGREIWVREFPGIGHPFTNLELEEQWTEGVSVYMSNIPGAAYIGSPYVTLPDSIYLRYQGKVFRLDPDSGETLAEFALYPGGADIPADDWGFISVFENYLVTTTGPHIFDDTKLGWLDSWNATSSKHLHVMDRFSGETLWSRTADIGFRHNAIAIANGRLFAIDGLSQKALEFLGRRGMEADRPSRIFALNLRGGETVWEEESQVFGTYLAYSGEHDILLESGSRDTRRALPDEPSQVIARRGGDGSVLWEGRSQFPAIILGERLIPARPGAILHLLTGETLDGSHPVTGEPQTQSYAKFYGCSTATASTNLLLFRSGAAGFADLQHDGGTGNFGGFKSGCTASMIAADGVLNAPDYTRTCQCSYQNQTSLGLIHMPEMDIWTSVTEGRGSGPIQRIGVNLGAPGNRRTETGTLWTPFPRVGTPTPELNVLINTVDFADTPVRIVAATASRGDLPSDSLDGSGDTAWQVGCNRNGRFGHWIRYDLIGPIQLDSMDVAWSGPEDTEFRIETSLDGEEWSSAFEEEGRGPGRETTTYSFPAVEAQYVRLNFGDHANTSEDSRGRRVQQTARVFQVRIGSLPYPDSYAYFLPKNQFRKHSLEVACDQGMNWVGASGIRGIRELIIPTVEGGDHPYTVNLHFAEPESVQPGERVFAIRVQDRTVAENFDVRALAGVPNRTVIRSFPGVRIGRALHVQFVTAPGSALPPVLSGVEIVRE